MECGQINLFRAKIAQVERVAGCSLLDQSKGIAKVEEMGIRLLFFSNS